MHCYINKYNKAKEAGIIHLISQVLLFPVCSLIFLKRLVFCANGGKTALRFYLSLLAVIEGKDSGKKSVCVLKTVGGL